MSGVVGVVLAGGAGSRMGGAKPDAVLAGRPLLAYPVAALRGAGLERVAVVAKGEAPLPDVGPVESWREPGEPRHPLVGIVEALRRANGAAVIVLACDLPLVTPALVRALAEADAAGAPAVVARAGTMLQPVCARYEPAALGRLRGFDPDARLVTQVEAIGPALLDVEVELLRNVNRPDDLAAIEARLAVGGGREPS